MGDDLDACADGANVKARVQFARGKGLARQSTNARLTVWMFVLAKWAWCRPRRVAETVATFDEERLPAPLGSLPVVAQQGDT